MRQEKQTLFTNEVIEFATVGVNFAGMMEQSDRMPAIDFVRHAIRVLPLLYLKTTLLPEYEYDTEEDYVEDYVDEDTYTRLQNQVNALLGSYDTFLTTEHSEMQYSDSPIAVSMGEYLADTYQQLVNLLGIIREGNESALPAAIGRCRYYFAEYWGDHLLAALAALHRIAYSTEALASLSGQSDHQSPTQDLL